MSLKLRTQSLSSDVNLQDVIQTASVNWHTLNGLRNERVGANNEQNH